MNAKLICLLVIGTALACKTSGARHGNSGLSSVSETVLLGMGYDNDSFQTRDRCIEGTEITSDQPAFTWKFRKVEDWDSERREMGFDLDGKYTYGIATGNARAQFTRNLQNTRLTTTYLLRSSYLKEVRFLERPALSGGFADAELQSPEQLAALRARCGTHYVSQMDNGGTFVAYVKFTFANESVMNKFSFEAGVDAGKAANVKASTNVMTEDEKKRSSVEIQVFQDGGRFGELQKFIDPTALVHCGLDQWENCLKVIEQLVSYSHDRFPEDVKQGGVRAFSYKTTPYPNVKFPLLPDDLVKRRDDTLGAIAAFDRDLTKIDQLLRHTAQLTADRKRELEGTQLTLRSNLNKLNANLKYCMEETENSPNCRDVEALTLGEYPAVVEDIGSQRVLGPAFGHLGGVGFQQVCANFMTGFLGSSGTILDQAAAKCDDGQEFQRVGSHEATNFQNHSCPKGSVVTGIKVGIYGKKKHRGFVGTLTFVCKDLAALRSGATPAPQEMRISNPGGTADRIWDCPSGFAASGIHGLAGKYVDRIGLVCSRY